jgi:hypothetical protein
VRLVGVARPAPVGEVLQLELEISEHRRIEQLAQLVRPEQLAQQVAIERQRGGSPLGHRRVAFVHVLRDPAEQQRRREGRRLGQVDTDHADGPRPQLAQHLGERREVEHVAQALARRLQEDREGRVPPRHTEQVGGALTLLPQRGPLTGSTTWEQQRPRRVLTEA